MCGAKRVIFALAALGEAGEAAARPQRADAIAAAGQDVVRIALVADIPHQPVARRIEDVMDRRREFHYTKPRAQMSPCHRNRADHFGAKFVDQLRQLFGRELAEVGRTVDGVEQRRCRSV